MAITMLAGYLVIINAAALLMMALGGSGGFGAAVPALFVYLALSVSLLRMLRHEAAVIAQRRFQALNLAGLAGVSVPPQNQALVFCGGYAADSGRTAGRWGVAGREQRPGLNNRNALPEQ